VRVDVYKLPMRAPDDLSALRAAIVDGRIDPAAIVALLGKTEGNGGVNDFTRRLATGAATRLLGELLGMEPADVERRVPMVWSGGCDGVISPHLGVVTRVERTGQQASGEPRLVVGTAFAERIEPGELGRMGQIRKLMAGIRAAMTDAGIEDPRDLHFVQTKNPSLSVSQIQAEREAGRQPATDDPRHSMELSTGAATFATALIAGELTEQQATEAAVGRAATLDTSHAGASAGGGIERPEMSVLGHSRRGSGPFRIGHAQMHDAIDADGVREALRSAGLRFEHLPSTEQLARVVAVFAKASPDPRGQVRGRRHVMLEDQDVHASRQIRAVVGGVIASVIADTAIYVSSGTRHQGPPGGGPVAAIVRVE
jgi:cyanuric acid amidohydrolase